MRRVIRRVQEELLRMGKAKSGKFYAVQNGRTRGVFTTWEECQKSVNGFPKARFKSFRTRTEAERFVEPGPAATVVQQITEPKSASRPVSRPASRPAPSSAPTTTLGSGPEPTAPAKTRSPRMSTANHEVVYTDGCARGNGRIGAVGGIGIYYGPDDPRNVAAPLLNSGKQTNQRAELAAAITAVENALKDASKPGAEIKGLNIHSDSEYAANCLTIWGDKWERKDYKRSDGGGISNLDLIKSGREKIKRYNELYNDRNGPGKGVVFTHVRGHAGILGNEMADRLANKGAGF
jgi:ribonuclease HI